MFRVRPFPGIRYVKHDLSRVIAPPYDVISKKERRALQRKSPVNVIRLILGNPSVQKHKSADYVSAAKTLQVWLKKGVLAREASPAVYVYRQTFKVGGKTYRRTGFFARRLLEASNKAAVRAHERTLAGPKQDRLRLTRAARMNFSAVFSLFDDPKGQVRRWLAAVVKKPAQQSARFPADILHELWVEKDIARIEKLQKLMQNRELFIADGHHRYETAVRYQKERSLRDPHPLGARAYDYVLMAHVAMQDPGLVILPTHRLLKGPLVRNFQEMREFFSSLGSVKEYPLGERALSLFSRTSRPAVGFSFDARTFGVLIFSRSALASSRLKKLSLALRSLDVTLLHRLILEPFFDISPETVEEKLFFTSDAWEAIRRLRKKEISGVFFLRPTRLEALKQVARRGERMPQKSTYFYPKLATGFVFHDLTEKLE